MELKRKLFVESSNDEHVLYSIFNKYSVPEGVFEVVQKNGVSNILKELRIQLKFQDEEKILERIGIVVDADDDLEKRWRELVKILEQAGYTDLPAKPDPGGTILRSEGMPTVGIWLMPDNQVPGKLENFVSFLVPPDDTLWNHALTCVVGLPERRFHDRDEIKAHVHTWLAWQKDPGTPMGWAITKGYLSANAEQVRQLVNWLRELFIN